ncbi:phage terminase large subunit [Gilliamella sp. B2772]|uniref:phage terminase large subunit n=1 Tax=Gilliamella sp. B2772 TaxID=2817981 RepID=UPI00226AF5D0|nr:phage terminase large subunit [Gilliamella sp. B2772]MCX8659869.1 phage terminase large subunit [Gilliamella sp. B2772]
MKSIELLLELRIRKARKSFLTYRQLINKNLKVNWWVKEVCEELEKFYYDFVNGLKPKLVIQAPPQHGKSVAIIDFISWVAGHNPDCKTIYASFSERLGIKANLKLQRIYDNPTYQKIFPDTKISNKNAVTISSQTLRNREIIEYIDRDGYFRNTTVRGSITGESLDLGVIDDPLKGRQDANSLTVRNSTWDWFTDDFLTRFSEDGALLAILTRWHIDDPIGRLIAADKTVKVLSYPAIAIKDDKHRKTGEALFPEHKSIDFLLARKKVMPAANFEALYQQNPYITDGGIFKTEWFKSYRVLPKLKFTVITVDTAQKTKEQNDYSVFALWGQGEDGNAYLIDILRGKWESPDLIKMAKAFWYKHVPTFNIRSMNVEDKVSGTTLIQTLSKSVDPVIPIKAVQRNIDKITRANDVAPFIESGRVYLPEKAEWLNDFIVEHAQFPNGAHDDQVDTTSDGLNIIFGKFIIDIWDVL